MFDVDGEKVRAAMVERRLNVAALARAADVNQATAARLIREGAKTTAPTLAKIADALGVSWQQLLKG